MFRIEMKTGNDAFGQDVADEKREIARILRDTADRLERGGAVLKVYDLNGNAVGGVDFVSMKRGV